MFRGKHKPLPFFSQTTSSRPQPVYPLSTIRGLPLERGTCCFLVHGWWSGGVQINKTLSRLVRVLTAHSHFSSALLLRNPTVHWHCSAMLFFSFFDSPLLVLSIFLCVFCLFCSFKIAGAGTIKCSAPELSPPRAEEKRLSVCYSIKPHPPLFYALMEEFLYAW